MGSISPNLWRKAIATVGVVQFYQQKCAQASMARTYFLLNLLNLND
jgi:hypothetical protein